MYPQVYHLFLGCQTTVDIDFAFIRKSSETSVFEKLQDYNLGKWTVVKF